jgi:hypothetical protein
MTRTPPQARHLALKAVHTLMARHVGKELVIGKESQLLIALETIRHAIETGENDCALRGLETLIDALVATRRAHH